MCVYIYIYVYVYMYLYIYMRLILDVLEGLPPTAALSWQLLCCRCQGAHPREVGGVRAHTWRQAFEGGALRDSGCELGPILQELPQGIAHRAEPGLHALHHGGRFGHIVRRDARVEPAVDMKARVRNEADGAHGPRHARGAQASGEGEGHEGHAHGAEASRGNVPRRRGRIEGRGPPRSCRMPKHLRLREDTRGRIGPLSQKNHTTAVQH